MKAIKKTCEVILTIIAVAAFVLCTAEAENGTLQLLWSFGWMAVLGICGCLLDMMGAFKKEDGK